MTPTGRCWLVWVGMLLASGCAAPPELSGYPVTTPSVYTEDKLFFLSGVTPPTPTTVLGAAEPAGGVRAGDARVALLHVHQVDPGQRQADVIAHGDPLAVILSGVRLPEDLRGGPRDIAVVLDINTNATEGVTPLVAFYQRDVPPGQMLNFSNLVVYADASWDSTTAPYFRIRVLDVRAERNRRAEAVLRGVSSLAAEVNGLIPHPIIPVVTRAIDAAGLILGNRRNVVLMDFQVQLYGQQVAENAGGAVLARLYAGQWLVLGRGRGSGAEFWARTMSLDLATDQVIDTDAGRAVPVPYVAVTISRADLQVPTLVMDRSQSLVRLLSSAEGKSDVDALEAAAGTLASGIEAYVAERRLTKSRSKADLEELVGLLDQEHTADIDGKAPRLNKNERRRLLSIVTRATGQDFGDLEEMLTWWNRGGKTGHFVPDPTAPLGVKWTVGGSPTSGPTPDGSSSSSGS